MYRICVITVRDELQKQIALAEIQRRRLRAIEFFVFVDPVPNLGSGGSTIHALQKLIDGGRIGSSVLIIHSGGRASRIEQFATVGKLFIPLPSAEYPTVFDLIIHSFSKLPETEGGQVIITPGDQAVFGLDNVVFNSTGITGVASFDNSVIASKHGVFFLDHSGEPCKVVGFHEKPIMRTWEYFWVDTGILHFAPDVVSELVDMDVVRSNLYSDILPMFKDRLYCYADPDVKFFHLGTHEDFVNNFIKLQEIMNENRVDNTAVPVSG